jgi:Mrp family chromosome partitioning ATPase
MFLKRRHNRNQRHNVAGAQSGAQYPENQPSLQLQAAGAESVYHFPLAMVQSLRQMVTRLQRDGKLAPKISIVAAHRQEGVSLTALALAATMAHDLSKTICLVDLNWWWPSQIMSDLGSASPGLAALLRNEIDWEQALVRTSLPNLALLPAGTVVADYRPVIARSTALKLCIEQLSERVDHILFDVPAILATSDAIPLTALSDACCVTVRQGVSTRAAVAHALDEVSHLAMLGVVLNRVQIATPQRLLKWVPEE